MKRLRACQSSILNPQFSILNPQSGQAARDSHRTRAPMVASAELDGRRRVIIEGVQPEVDAGLFPAKRVVGDTVVVEADIFADGHDVLSAVVLHRHASEKKPREVRMIPMPNDRWRAELMVE